MAEPTNKDILEAIKALAHRAEAESPNKDTLDAVKALQDRVEAIAKALSIK